MKITAVPKGAGAQPTANPNAGASASPDRIAKAKAAAAGQDPAAAQTQQAQHPETVTEKLKRIRMRTNVTPGPREYAQTEVPQTETVIENPAVVTQEADISDTTEPTSEAPEDSKPLSPQFAALVKAKRALQVKEREILAREEALKNGSQSTQDVNAFKERIKADPLGLLFENGHTYETLIQIVEDMSKGGGPALTKVETELRKEMKLLKEELESSKKAQTDEKTQSEQRAMAHLQRQADHLIATDDNYQMIRETGSNKDVTDLITRVLKEDGETLEVKEALELIENDLLEESLKIARIKKVQTKLAPEPVITQQTAPANSNDGVRRQTMRTLTTRDNVSAVPSRRERAMAAALGKKLA